mmetsp:Transcript_5499/g.9334  ORF Transcript_5499/g.9334 Transcript_5499/m.9334 type:complete len:123 (-) Transcript_5499:421-789(-)
MVELCTDQVLEMLEKNLASAETEGLSSSDLSLMCQSLLPSASKLVRKHDIDGRKDAKLFMLIEWCLRRAVLQRNDALSQQDILFALDSILPLSFQLKFLQALESDTGDASVTLNLALDTLKV